MSVHQNSKLVIRQACVHDAKDMSQVIRTCIEVTHGRNYTAEEIDVWKAAYSTKAIRKLLCGERWVYLLQAGADVCGTIQFDIAANEIKGFYVHPAYQHQGYGSILFTFLLGKLKSTGLRNVELSSNPHFKGYYELFSFKAKHKETVTWGGLEFEEYRMKRTLIH